MSIDPHSLHHSQHDSLHIFIKDFNIQLQVGIYPHELEAPQPLIINIDCETALPFHYNNLAEKLSDRVIDYDRLYHFLKVELPQRGHIYLLETLADEILSFCFLDKRIRKATIRVEKTGAFSEAASAGVEITRYQQERAA